MTRPNSRLRQAFDRAERTVGVPLENAVASNRFMDVMTIGMKVRRGATARVFGVVHGVTGGILHAVNIPTRDDVRQLNNHLTALAGELRAIEQRQRRATTTRRGSPTRAEASDD